MKIRDPRLLSETTGLPFEFCRGIIDAIDDDLAQYDEFSFENFELSHDSGLRYGSLLRLHHSKSVLSSFDDMTEAECRIEASGYSCQDEQEGDIPVDLVDWTHESQYPIEKFSCKFDLDGAANWFKNECLFHLEEGRLDFVSLLVHDIKTPIIFLEIDDIPYIWDGWHRVAASIIKEEKYIGAIVGHPVPNLSLRRPI